MKSITIAGRQIGEAYPPFIIAELSANHNGSLERGLETIRMAKKMGADAVKFQTYTADSMTLDSEEPDFMISGGLWDGYNLYKLYQEAHTPFEWHKQLFELASNLNIICFSTPFDEKAVDFLEDLNTPAYKIASFEAVDLPLIKYAASTGKPMIISTGMASLDEIEEAVDTAQQSGCNELALLHCISAYPAPASESNLKTIPDIVKRFNVVTGLSDHTLGTAVSVSSISLGAALIEKHFILSRNDIGPDSSFSLEPAELKKLCEDSKTAWLALGHVNYEKTSSEIDNVKFRRSIYAVTNIARGETLTTQNIKRIRPGFGLAPKYYEQLVGKVAAKDIPAGTPMSEDLVIDGIR